MATAYFEKNAGARKSRKSGIGQGPGQFDFNFVKLLWRLFLDARAKPSEKICFFLETPARMVENLKNFQPDLLQILLFWHWRPFQGRWRKAWRHSVRMGKGRKISSNSENMASGLEKMKKMPYIIKAGKQYGTMAKNFFGIGFRRPFRE